MTYRSSLRASASFKYFGNGQGITIYSHLDEVGQLIYSTAFSAADRESPYMLDAITYNEQGRLSDHYSRCPFDGPAWFNRACFWRDWLTRR